ncbi:MAG: hypothetical protein HY704_03765 [Gemmatimonadetes bacterium]|nr:hypothetical protein [Gemmatimonadota bacterium]
MRQLAAGFLVLALYAACGDSPTEGQADGEDWGPDVRLTFDPASSQLSFNFAWSIAADGDGPVHAVWYDRRHGASQVFYRRSQTRR